jgi:hypothetical protein
MSHGPVKGRGFFFAPNVLDSVFHILGRTF